MLNGDNEYLPQSYGTEARETFLLRPMSTGAIIKTGFSIYKETALELIIQWFLRLILPLSLLFTLFMPVAADIMYGLIYLFRESGDFYDAIYYLRSLSYYFESYELAAASSSLVFFLIIWFYQGVRFKAFAYVITVKNFLAPAFNDPYKKLRKDRFRLQCIRAISFIIKLILYPAILILVYIIFGLFKNAVIFNPYLIVILVSALFFISILGFVLSSLLWLYLPAAISEKKFGIAAFARSITLSWHALSQVLVLKALSIFFVPLPGFSATLQTLLYFNSRVQHEGYQIWSCKL